MIWIWIWNGHIFYAHFFNSICHISVSENMPLISHHLTFVPEGLKRSNDYTEEEGLAAHSDNVTKCVARSYKEKSYTDLIFVCK